MSEIRSWLEAIGLGQYADAFKANDIDTELLPQIDDQLLKDIGMSSAGHRLRIRSAIAKLAPTSVTQPNATSAAGATEVPAPSAERRQLMVIFCDLVRKRSNGTSVEKQPFGLSLDRTEAKRADLALTARTPCAL